MKKGQKNLKQELKETLERFPDQLGKVNMVQYENSAKEVRCPECKPPESPKDRFTSAVPPPDPWAHRSIGMKCHSCMAFVLKGAGPIGRCRRNAPTMNGFPVVFETDWCLQHRLDETKY